MRTLKVLLLAALVLIITVNLQAEKTDGTITFAMCRPQLSQVKNIQLLWEQDIITLRKIHVIGVYHQDESLDYQPAIDYVEENKLTWFTFFTIKEPVPIKELFRENAWTPQFRAIFEKTAGIIFTGGSDIPPAVYNQDQLLLTSAQTPNRSLYETSFLFHLLGSNRNPTWAPFLEKRKDYVVLGICLGSQTMNVATGGTLYQDIPSQVYKLNTVQEVLAQGQEKIHSGRYVGALHPLEDDFLPPALHRVKLEKKGKFVRDMHMKETDTPYILSAHHQAFHRIGQNLRVIAVSMDGEIPEALEHVWYKNVLGVQFHPEYRNLYTKGKYYMSDPGPGAPLDFNLKFFLEANPPSLPFHHRIWKWFSEALQ